MCKSKMKIQVNKKLLHNLNLQIKRLNLQIIKRLKQ